MGKKVAIHSSILVWEIQWIEEPGGLQSMESQTIGLDLASYFKSILKDDAVKVLHLICQHIWKTQLWPQDWKRSVFIPIPKKGNVKECLNYPTIGLISHASKVMLKLLQARLQSI